LGTSLDATDPVTLIGLLPYCKLVTGTPVASELALIKQSKLCGYMIYLSYQPVAICSLLPEILCPDKSGLRMTRKGCHLLLRLARYLNPRKAARNIKISPPMTISGTTIVAINNIQPIIMSNIGRFSFNMDFIVPYIPIFDWE
jgi:hypothetical protein